MSSVPSSEHRRGTQTSNARSGVNVLLACAGLALFLYLVSTSGVTVAMLRDIGWTVIALLFALFGVVVVLDTIAWYYAVRHVARPNILTLLRLRIAGDALTNGLPGGVVLGETYKALMMRRFFGISLADNAATLLLVKFGLGFSQAIFVLVGLALCYPALRDRSLDLFGFSGAQHIGLALTAGMGLITVFPLVLMLRGNSFSAAANALGRLPITRLRRWLLRRKPKFDALDASCASALRTNRNNVLLTFFYLLIGWLATSVESYVLMLLIGLTPTYRVAYVMESVGSMFRLIFFMVPSGIGGQDASYIALFRLYGLPTPAGGAFVLIKRFKELLWMGLGFVLIPLRRHPKAEESPHLQG